MRRISRRRLLASGMIGAGLNMLGISRLGAQTAVPVRIGIVVPVTGAAAPLIRDWRYGAELTTQRINRMGGIGGRPVELVLRDTNSNPNDAAAAVRELLADGIALFGAGYTTAEVLAIHPLFVASNAINISTASILMALTHDQFDRHWFRCNENDHEAVAAGARLAADRYPNISNWATIGSDTAANRDTVLSFRRLAAEEYEKIGKKIVFADPILVKFGTADFKNQLSAIMSSNVEGLFSQVFGQDGITFWQQAHAFDVSSKLKVILDIGGELTFAKALRQNLPANFWSTSRWYYGIHQNNPISRDLYDAYVAETKNPYPSGNFYGGSTVVFTYAQAIAAAGGRTDPDTLIKVLEDGLVIQTIIGPLTYRKDHQAQADVSFINFGPSSDPPGFKMYDSVTYDGAALLEPPAPGVAFKP